MRFLTMMFLFAIATAGFKCEGQSSSDLDKLGWLEGTWKRTNAKAGRSGHERWLKVSASEYQGWGVTFSGADTAFVEKLKIVSKDNQFYYVADVAHNAQPVYFKFTAVSSSGFTCENPSHDFPKKIEYVLEGNVLKATISGDGKSMPYIFIRE